MTTNIFQLIKAEEKRQEETLMMIPSENYASKNVLKALGSVLANKYAEGYPKKRYYQGNGIVDQIELMAINKTKELFKVAHCNVQPYSGSPANNAVYFALLEKTTDSICGLKLSSGGHLTHGHPKVTLIGKYFQSWQYDLDINQKDHFDYDLILKEVKKNKPKVIVVGTTAYPRILNWEKFAEIAAEVKAYLLADISHIAGLILAGVYPSPVPFVDIVTTTTHKTLRGPRGAIIMVTEKGLQKDLELPKKIDAAVFPGLQGGPHMNQIAALVVALDEAKKPSFKKYGEQIVNNAKELEKVFQEKEIYMVTGGTDSHLLLLDLAKSGFSPGMGFLAAYALECANIILNKNSVPNDPSSAFYPSGVRLGTPGLTTRGMKEKEMRKIGNWIVDICRELKGFALPKDEIVRKEKIREFKLKIVENQTVLKVKKEVIALCRRFPVYSK